jgi:YHS domain-containing protein
MKNSIEKRVNTCSKSNQEKTKDFVLNSFAIIALAIPFTLSILDIYEVEKEELENKEAYEASMPKTDVLIEPSKICMAKNEFMGGDDQTLLAILDKKYFACSAQCIRTLQINEKDRFAIDQISKMQVDKSHAFICMHPNRSGKVCYFESKDNYLAFLKLNTP